MDCVFVVEHTKAPHVCFPVCLHACVLVVAFACLSAWRSTVYLSNGNRTSNSLRVLVAAIHRTAATTVFVTVHACTRAGVHVAQLSAHSTWNYTQSSPKTTHPLPETTLSSPETAQPSPKTTQPMPGSTQQTRETTQPASGTTQLAPDTIN